MKRWRTIARWACTLAMTVLLVVAFVGIARPTQITNVSSAPAGGGPARSRLAVYINVGLVSVSWFDGYRPSGNFQINADLRAQLQLHVLPNFQRFTMPTPPVNSVRLPVGPPLLLIVAITALLWRSHLRARRPGLCPSCRYSLTGLPTGSPCPECGKPAA